MDDIYQYTASAVQANNKESQTAEENDPLVNAFRSFGFGKRWTSLVDSVKKGSEQVIAVTRNDLQEFAQVIRDDTTHVVDKIIIPTSPTSPTTPAATTADVKGKSRAMAVSPSAEAAEAEEAAAEDQQQSSASLWGYVSQLSSQLPSAIHLPDNIDLGRLREEMDQGTRFAEQYLQKFGTEVMHTLNKTITVLDPEDEDDQGPVGRTSTSSGGVSRVFASRKDQLLAEMRVNPDTFLEDSIPADLEKSVLEKLDAEKRTDDISDLLEEHPELREMMDRLVPVEVSYTLFWKRYFYHTWKIEEDDRKRHIIAEAAENDDDFKWDSDEEEDRAATKKEESKGKEPVKEEKDGAMPKEVPEAKEEPSVAAKKEAAPPVSKQADASDDSDSDWE